MTTVDPFAIHSVQMARALTDPFIVHKPRERRAFPSDHPAYEHARSARLARLMGHDEAEPITKATWPELVIFLQTASHDERVVTDDRFADRYGWACRKYIDKWQDGVEPTDAVAAIAEATPPNEYDKAWLDTLRQKIKESQDKHHLEHEWDPDTDPHVPKRFWTDYHGSYPIHGVSPADGLNDGDDLFEQFETAPSGSPTADEL